MENANRFFENPGKTRDLVSSVMPRDLFCLILFEAKTKMNLKIDQIWPYFSVPTRTIPSPGIMCSAGLFINYLKPLVNRPASA